MNSRDKILAAVKANQPATTPLPDIHSFERNAAGSLDKFTTVLKMVGGSVYYVNNFAEVANILRGINGEDKKIISPLTQLREFYNEAILSSTHISDLEDIDVFVVNGQFAVAENGAIWITDKEMYQRVLPFITQHLAIIINAENVVPTMHEAYGRISKTSYGFGTFIAGPSKTADIEQSLVIGAHGPRSMTAFIMNTAL
jgi:L-lactate dehydrogenase complex protein LldG